MTAIIAWALYPTLLSLIFKQSSTTGSVCDWFMEKHLSAITIFSTEIRDHAISILRNFSNPDILLENTTYYIPDGRALPFSFYATSGAIIKANITANSNVLIEIYGPEGAFSTRN